MSEKAKGHLNDGLAKTGEEIELLLAIQAQLKSLDRITPCKRREDLQVLLTEMLNDSKTQHPSILVKALEEERIRATRVAEELERLRSSLNFPEQSGIQDGKTPEIPANDTQPPGCFRYLAFCVVAVVVIFMMIVFLFHRTPN
jgi:hypothetical protein